MALDSEYTPRTRQPIACEIEGCLADAVRVLADYWDRPVDHTLVILLRSSLREATSRMMCRDCGCTLQDPCLSESGLPCGWAEEDLCTFCADTQQVSVLVEVADECAP